VDDDPGHQSDEAVARAAAHVPDIRDVRGHRLGMLRQRSAIDDLDACRVVRCPQDAVAHPSSDGVIADSDELCSLSDPEMRHKRDYSAASAGRWPAGIVLLVSVTPLDTTRSARPVGL